MKKALLIFLLVIAIGACKKETDQNPADLNCYPKTVTRTVSFSSDVIITKFTYDDNNKISKEEIFNNNLLSKTGIYIYNADGKLIQKDYYAESRLTERDAFTLNAAGKPDKLLHGYLDSVGLFSLHHYRIFKYSPEGKIAKITDFTPEGRIISGLTYEHQNNSFIKTISVGQDGKFLNNNEITYDANHNPFSATDIYLNGLNRNVLTQIVKDSTGNVTKTISNEITYNARNFPVKIIQTHSDGLTLTEEFAY